MNPEDIEEMNAIWWWHEIELEPGVRTNGHGKKDIAAHATSQYGIPACLAGQEVLDIGGWDGGYSFECERRGASRVVMCDVYQNPDVGQQGAGFRLAKRVLRSNVEFFPLDIDGLLPQFTKSFDLVLFLGVLYHIDNMFRALGNICEVLRPGGVCIVETAFDSDMSAVPIARWRKGYLDDPYNRWFPNRACLEAMAKDAGFSRVEAGVQERADRGTYHLFT